MSTEWAVVPPEATREMISAVRAGTIEPQSMTHQLRIVERIQNDYLKLLAARPTGPDVPKLLVPRTEAEWREEFEKWHDSRSVKDWNDCNRLMRCNAWLAALRLVNAVKP